MFFSMIQKNGKTHYKNNGIYFLSLVIAIVASYVILALEEQDVMLFLKEMESDAVTRLFVMIKAVYIASLFLIFLMIYFAQKYQLEERNHEFGMLLMLGMPRRRLFGLLMVEDVYTTMVSLLLGLPVAVVLSESVSLITAKLVGMGIIGHHFSFSLRALCLTAAGFFLIKSVANMILSSGIVKKEPGYFMQKQVEQTYKNVHWGKELAGIVLGSGCLVSAYIIALTNKRILYHVTWVMVVMLLGVIGTYWVLKGVCVVVRILYGSGRTKAALHTFTFRQLQENIFGKGMSLTVSSLLILLALVSMGYGVSVSVFEAGSYEHSMDYTLESYDKETKQGMEKLLRDSELENVIDKWITVDVGVLKIESDNGRAGKSYDVSDIQGCAKRLNQENWDAFYQTTFYYGVFRESSDSTTYPYLIPLSAWNELQKASGKEALSLDDREIALYVDPELLSGEATAAYEKILEQNPCLKLDGISYRIVSRVCSEDIVVDRSITIGYGFVVRDEMFTRYVDESTCTTYWNGYLNKDLIQEKGLMLAIRTGNALLDSKGVEYESYLQNMGRQVFYIVAASYLTIYFAFIFLLIANTTISLQFLMQEKRGKGRYQTLIRMGSRYEYLCKSAKTQIGWNFIIPILPAGISSLVGIVVLFQNMLPEMLQSQRKELLCIAGAVIFVVTVIEWVYVSLVFKLSRQNLSRMMEITREEK